MKNCKYCGTEVSESAKVCPKCGRKLKHTGLRVFIGIIIVFIGIGMIFGGANNPNTSNTATNSSSSETQVSTKATMEKFNKIQTGMTYQEVVEIMGEEGTLSTESSYGDQTMQVYGWYAENGIANCTVSFMNGKVQAKSQLGLK